MVRTLTQLGDALDVAETEFYASHSRARAESAIWNGDVGDAYDAYRAALKANPPKLPKFSMRTKRGRDKARCWRLAADRLIDAHTSPYMLEYHPLPPAESLRELADREAALRIAHRDFNAMNELIWKWERGREKRKREQWRKHNALTKSKPVESDGFTFNVVVHRGNRP